MQLGIDIKRSAHDMTNMVDNMLAYSRTRLSGVSLPVHAQPAALAGTCVDAIADAQSLHPLCHFQMHADGRLDADLDPDRMRQLLVNPLANAGQHGNRESSIRLHASGDERETVLSVVNQGPGIPPEYLQSIFDALVHVPVGPDAPARPLPSLGLGLGLHIAREIASADRGSIDAESSSESTTFRVRLTRHVR